MGHPFRLVSQLNPVVISGNVTMSGAPAISIDGNTAGVPAIISDGTLQLAGGNNITLSQNGSSITISAANLGAGAGVVLYDGANSITSGTARFSNANGISFGFNGQTITGSHNGLTSQSNQAYSAGNGSAAFQTLSFADSNGVSFSTGTQGLYATVKTDYLTSQSNQAVSAANGSFTFQTLTVANSNGVSFSTGTQGLYATVKTDYLTTARASNDAIGLNTAQSNVTWTVNSAGLSLDARGYAGTGTSATNASITLNSDGLAISVAAPGAGGGVGIEAGTRTATTAGTLRFETGNGITFGLDSPGGSVMTASHNGLTTARASTDAVGLNTALTAGPLAWTVNSSGISLNAGSAAGTTSGFGGNLISGSMTHNTAGLNLSLDHPAWLTTAMQSNAATISNIRVSGGTTSNLLSAITFADSNGVSFGLNAGTMTATVKTDYLTSQSNQAVSANNGSYAFQTLSFSNANGISFGTSAGSAITASHNGLTTARASTDAIGLNTAQTNVTWTVNSSGLSLNAAGYAGTATTFNGANISGSMTVNTAGVNLSMSVAAPGAAAENNNINLLGANTAGNTTASGSTIGLSGINLTLSGTNNSVVNISAPATSSLSATGIVSLSTNGSTISIGAAMTTQSSYWEGIDRMTLLHAGANGNISVERFKVDQYVSATMIGIPQYQSISSSGTANTYGQQWSIYAMVLTNDTANNRLMSLSSGSTQTTYTMASNNAGATQIIGSGVRPLTVPININMTPGIYYMAFNLSTNTFSSGTATTALNRTASFIGRGPLMSASFGMVSAYDVATGNTVNRLWPQGVVSGGASAGIPATISHSQMTMTGLSHSQANLAFYMRA